MDYKALYGIIFAPIFITLIYMGYLSYSQSGKSYSNSNTQNINMTDNSSFDQISAEDFKTELNNGDTILIDVRTIEEQEKYGTISDDQLHIVYGSENFEEEILNLDKEKKYLVYCWHGVRSAATREFMQASGFSWTKDLKGGIDKWKQ